SDAGYIYKIYGFGYIRELELLREAGLNALEVIHAASLAGAEALNMDDDIGSVAIGKRADMVIVSENPMDNFKVLYGTGHFKLDDNNQPMRTEGIQYTIKDGVIFDAQQLLQDVKAIVAEEKAERQ
ncbi:MAG: amidohydrolase family protein, partial [Idiomarina sp.]|nr:amidohydrolase family protein [Idiomarina sp.]